MIVNEEDLYEQLVESCLVEYEVLENENIYLKIAVLDRKPPLTVLIKYLDKKPDLTVYIGQDQR